MRDYSIWLLPNVGCTFGFSGSFKKILGLRPPFLPPDSDLIGLGRRGPGPMVGLQVSQMILICSQCQSHLPHFIREGAQAQRRRRLGGPRCRGFSQQAGGTVAVSSAAPHYNRLTLNSFSTPPTFHIFLVIRQQSMLLCVAWAHCFSGLTDFYSLGLFFFPIEKLLLFLCLPE